MFYRKKWEGEVGKRSRHRRIAMLTIDRKGSRTAVGPFTLLRLHAPARQLFTIGVYLQGVALLDVPSQNSSAR